MRNKPNSVRPAGRPGLPGGKTCKTNPIPDPAGWAGALGAKNVKRTQFGQAGRQTAAPESGNVRNKPNFAGRLGPWRAKRTKRSQFPTIGRPHHSSPIPIVQNEANLPAARDAAGGRRGQSYKQSQFAPGGPGRPSPRPSALTLPPITGPMVRNKANSVRGSRESSAFQEKSYGGLDMRAKQSQFPRRWDADRTRASSLDPRPAGRGPYPSRLCKTNPICRRRAGKTVAKAFWP